MTGFTATEFQALWPHVAPAFEPYMGPRTLDGQPRTSRRESPYVHGPFPPMADTLLFILSSWQHPPIQARQGPLFGRAPSKAHTWIPLGHAVLNLP